MKTDRSVTTTPRHGHFYTRRQRARSSAALRYGNCSSTLPGPGQWRPIPPRRWARTGTIRRCEYSRILNNASRERQRSYTLRQWVRPGEISRDENSKITPPDLVNVVRHKYCKSVPPGTRQGRPHAPREKTPYHSNPMHLDCEYLLVQYVFVKTAGSHLLDLVNVVPKH